MVKAFLKQYPLRRSNIKRTWRPVRQRTMLGILAGWHRGKYEPKSPVGTFCVHSNSTLILSRCVQGFSHYILLIQNIYESLIRMLSSLQSFKSLMCFKTKSNAWRDIIYCRVCKAKTVNPYILKLLYKNRQYLYMTSRLCSLLLRQVHTHFQNEFYTKCDLVLPLSAFSIFSFT